MKSTFGESEPHGNGPKNDSNCEADTSQHLTPFETLYPAIQSGWGLPDNIPNTPPRWMRATSRAGIALQLKKVRDVSKVPIGRRLATYIAMWAMWQRPKGMGGPTGEWDVRFIRRALSGRVPQFVQWAIEHPSPSSDLAVKAIRMVYDFEWPHQASTEYIFLELWGWMQLELCKPGERKPASIAEQRAFLEMRAEQNGEKVVGWSSLGGMGIMAITEPKDK